MKTADHERTQVLSATESVCPECLARIPAFRVARGDDVYLRKTCFDHGLFETVIWRGQPSFTSWMRPKIPAYPEAPFTTIAEGCPFDCGLCPDHRQQTCTALLEVTQRCDLGCAYCFASSNNSRKPDPPLAIIKGWYRRVLDAGGPYNIQLSGGEPTMRDDLPEIVALGRRLGFEFIQVNTNGLRFAREPAYVKVLKEAGLSSVFLQFDGTTDWIYETLRGKSLLSQKKSAIAQCAEHDLGVVLVPTLVPGVNTHDIGGTIDFARQYVPVVRGVHFQPVSYFGRYPNAPHNPADNDRITIPEIIRAAESQTGGQIKGEDFGPPGCENAWCSFHGNFVLMPDGELRPWIKSHATGCCCGPEKAEEGARKARSFVARYWISPSNGTSHTSRTPGTYDLGEWETFLSRVRTHSLCISGMAFQDAWSLDLERLRDCCIHTVSPDGRIVPFCAYNLTSRSGRPLYRGVGA
jgi:uncharacterized radical SAM superfamily Fe-S cluster-containing enzyme